MVLRDVVAIAQEITTERVSYGSYRAIVPHLLGKSINDTEACNNANPYQFLKSMRVRANNSAPEQGMLQPSEDALVDGVAVKNLFPAPLEFGTVTHKPMSARRIKWQLMKICKQ